MHHFTHRLSEPDQAKQARQREQALRRENILLRERILRYRQVATKLHVQQRTRTFSPFPYSLLEHILFAGFDGLELIVGRAIRAINRPRVR